MLVEAHRLKEHQLAFGKIVFHFSQQPQCLGELRGPSRAVRKERKVDHLRLSMSKLRGLPEKLPSAGEISRNSPRLHVPESELHQTARIATRLKSGHGLGYIAGLGRGPGIFQRAHAFGLAPS